jgi:hypothetical protein
LGCGQLRRFLSFHRGMSGPTFGDTRVAGCDDRLPSLSPLDGFRLFSNCPGAFQLAFFASLAALRRSARLGIVIGSVI